VNHAIECGAAAGIEFSRRGIILEFRIAMAISIGKAFSFGSLHERILRPVNSPIDFNGAIFLVHV